MFSSTCHETAGDVNGVFCDSQQCAIEEKYKEAIMYCENHIYSLFLPKSVTEILF